MRLYTIFLSVAAHAAMLIVVVVVPLAAMDALPGIHVVTPFVRVTQAELPKVPPPPGSRPPSSASPVVNDSVAPLTAPTHIAPEVTSAGPPYPGPEGVPGGPDSLGGIGATIPIPPPPQVTAPIRPHAGIKGPTKIKHVAPNYPEIARVNRVRGTVILEAVIGETGRVREVRVLRSIPLLDNAAMDAVRQWEFTPTLLNGQPVPVLLTVTVMFELN